MKTLFIRLVLTFFCVILHLVFFQASEIEAVVLYLLVYLVISDVAVDVEQYYNDKDRL